MRRFTGQMSWSDINNRLTPAEFRKTYGLSHEAFDDVLAIISPLICPKMRKTMSVSSAHKLGELGFGHIMPRFEPNKQSLIVGKPDNAPAYISLKTLASGLPMIELIDDAEVTALMASG